MVGCTLSWIILYSMICHQDPESELEVGGVGLSCVVMTPSPGGACGKGQRAGDG